MVMSGATTGLQMLKQALANWPILETTWQGGPPPGIDPTFCKLYGPLPQGNAEYYRGQCSGLIHTPIPRRYGFIHTQRGPILMRILLATRGTTTDSLSLLSVRMKSIMGRQFVDREVEHLEKRTVVGRRAEHLQEPTVMGRGAERPQ